MSTLASSGANAPAALLIARWWSRPTPAELAIWDELWPDADAIASSLAVDANTVAALRHELDDASAEALLDEYERLFVGPGRPPCAPYESLWSVDVQAQEQGMLMGSLADAVAQLYRGLGVTVRSESGELPDHLLVEWEALAYALDREAADAADALLHNHLCRWIGPFCNRVARETKQPFYAMLAALTVAWTAALAMTDTAVLLCERTGLELDAVSGSPVHVVDNLCDAPRGAVRVLRSLGAQRVVLGLCDHRPSRELLGALRRTGAVPFGIQAVALRGRDHREAALLLAAAAAKLDALAAHERGKPMLSEEGMSRRALFSPGSVLADAPVAVLDAEACVGTAGCGICVTHCPERAIRGDRPAPSIDPAACTGCGGCVPRCPSGALRLAGSATTQIEAQLDQLLPGIDGIMFACESARAAAPPGWALVELPTLTLLTPGWILQVRARGADVGITACEGDCCLGIHDVEALANRIASVGGRPQPPVDGPIRLGEPVATATGVLHTAAPDASLVSDDPCSPLGILQLDRERCTLCGACEIACPTDALRCGETDQRTVLSHDPAACVGCGRCTTVCPENALAVHRGIDVARLRAGPYEMTQARRERCMVCAAQLPPPQLRRRLRELLPMISDAPLELCTACAARAKRSQAHVGRLTGIESGDHPLTASSATRDRDDP